MRRIACCQWFSRVALAGAAFVLADASPAHAVIVQGRFDVFPVDWTGSFPAPLQLPPLSTAPAVAGFSFDTDRVSSTTGTTSWFNDPGAASVFLTVNGYTYSTTSGPNNAFEVTFGKGGFFMADFALLADPSNPLPWLPRINFGNGNLPDAFIRGSLPTVSFPTSAFEDADVDLDLQPPGQQRIRFRATGDVSIRTVPEPRATWLLSLVPIVALGIRRWRLADARTPAPCPSP